MPTADALEGMLLAATGSASPDPRSLKGAPPGLLRLRQEMGTVATEPFLLHGLRRGRLLGWDRETATWEVWDGAILSRRLVQISRPNRTADAERRWQAQQGIAGLHGHAILKTPVPHLRTAPFRWSLADLLPMVPDPLFGVRLYGRLLSGVASLHRAGRWHGQLCPSLVLEEDGEWRIAALCSADGDPTADLQAVGMAVRQLGVTGELLELAETMAELPPPSVEEAVTMFRGALARDLTAAHHEALREARSRSRRGRYGKLRTLGATLQTLVPPPVAAGCVRVSGELTFHLVESDGSAVWSGVVAQLPAKHLPKIWERDCLDVTAVRALLRAWGTRRSGNERERVALQQRTGADEAAMEALMRWLAASARLRAELILLRAAEAR